MEKNGISYENMDVGKNAEGFELVQVKQEFNLDLHQVAEIWQYRTVILDLTAAALDEDP